jgi:hypothetical protein
LIKINKLGGKHGKETTRRKESKMEEYERSQDEKKRKRT